MVRETSWQYYSRIYPAITSLKRIVRLFGGLLGVNSVRWGLALYGRRLLCTVGACLPPCLLKSSTFTGLIKARPKSPSRDEAASSKKSKAFHYSNNHEAEMFEPRSLHTKKPVQLALESWQYIRKPTEKILFGKRSSSSAGFCPWHRSFCSWDFGSCFTPFWAYPHLSCPAQPWYGRNFWKF